jgi:hypothetical protein
MTILCPRIAGHRTLKLASGGEVSPTYHRIASALISRLAYRNDWFLFCSERKAARLPPMAFHPPTFHPSHRLSDWPDCYLEIRCPQCGKSTVAPLQLLLRGDQDGRILDLISRFRCDRCNVKPAPVYLCASPTRTFAHGPAPDWSLELVQPPAMTKNGE